MINVKKLIGSNVSSTSDVPSLQRQPCGCGFLKCGASESSPATVKNKHATRDDNKANEGGRDSRRAASPTWSLFNGSAALVVNIEALVNGPTQGCTSLLAKWNTLITHY